MFTRSGPNIPEQSPPCSTFETFEYLHLRVAKIIATGTHLKSYLLEDTWTEKKSVRSNSSKVSGPIVGPAGYASNSSITFPWWANESSDWLRDRTRFLASDQRHCPNRFSHEPAFWACRRLVQPMASATIASGSIRKAVQNGSLGPRIGLVATAHRITHPFSGPRPTPAPMLSPERLGSETSVPSFPRRADSGRVVRPLRPMFTNRVSLFQTCVPKVSVFYAIRQVPLGSETLRLTISSALQPFRPACFGIETVARYARILITWGRTLLCAHPPSCFPHLVLM